MNTDLLSIIAIKTWRNITTNRVIFVWNSLPNYVVFAGTVNTFKSQLDKSWSNQDYKADLRDGTCNRSICV